MDCEFLILTTAVAVGRYVGELGILNWIQTLVLFVGTFPACTQTEEGETTSTNSPPVPCTFPKDFSRGLKEGKTRGRSVKITSFSLLLVEFLYWSKSPWIFSPLPPPACMWESMWACLSMCAGAACVRVSGCSGYAVPTAVSLVCKCIYRPPKGCQSLAYTLDASLYGLVSPKDTKMYLGE